MNQYKKGSKTINATEKAFEVIYKGQGYVLVEEKKEEVNE